MKRPRGITMKKTHLAAFSLTLISQICTGANSSDVTCMEGRCTRALMISEERSVCVRYIVPTNKDGTLRERWVSGTAIEIASRLNNESCAEAPFFEVDDESAEHVVAATKALHTILRTSPSPPVQHRISPETLACLSAAGETHVTGGEMSDEKDHSAQVTLDVSGCEQEVQVSVKMKQAWNLTELAQPNNFEIKYKVPIISGTDVIH